ncbi:type IV secretion system DNA-binding domain-containing protein [Xanthomonas sp. NCPPB 2632]|uniref:type IV secretion system DNA-binding domain-containing protein n=1 Tax=Xanthomonas sp. NCPPB 2632 TaxID=3240912 RepID=UPI00351648D2
MANKKLFQKATPAPEKRGEVVDHFFGPLPQLPPTAGLRRWDSAFIAALLVVVGVLLLGALLGGPWTRSQLLDALWVVGNMLLPHTVTTSPPFHPGMLLPLVALIPGVLVFGSGLKPRFGVRHIDGQRVVRGREAVKAFQMEARRMGLTAKNALASLHPAAMWPAGHWKKHMLIVGGVGSGKTVILMGLVKQLFADNRKLFLVDIKGDFTQRFPKAAILSPFDERSFVWHVALDVQTGLQAAAMAQAFIPVESDSGGGRYWSQAAQMLLEGTIVSLQHDMPKTWGFADLRDRLQLAQAEFAALMAVHFKKAEALISDPDSSATSSVLGTLSAYTASIEKLALAWPRPVPKRSISLTRWIADDYKGPRQIIVQMGADADLGSAIITAQVSVLATAIISPSLPDDQDGRHLFFVLDEFTSLRRIEQLPSLIDKGRSKGTSCVLAVQDGGQLIERYGSNLAGALSAMVGTQILCRTMPGETRERLIQNAGKKRVAVTSVTSSGGFRDGVAGSSSTSAQEENVLTGEDLTSLGPVFRRGKFQGIKALCTTGGDYLELLWPPQNLSVLRPGQVPAAWTLPNEDRGVTVILPQRVHVPELSGVPQQVAEDAAQRLGGERLAEAMRALKKRPERGV